MNHLEPLKNAFTCFLSHGHFLALLSEKKKNHSLMGKATSLENGLHNGPHTRYSVATEKPAVLVHIKVEFTILESIKENLLNHFKQEFLFI